MSFQPPAPFVSDPGVQQNFDKLRSMFPLGPASLLGASPSTGLPSSPVNGQDLYYVADSTNGVEWHFKYRSGSASSLKWEFVGGGQMRSEILTAESTTSTTYVDLATVGPSLTIPFNGDYEIVIVTQCGNATATDLSAATAKLGTAATSDNDGTAHTSATASAQGTPSRTMVRAGLTAGAVIKMQYRSGGGGSATFQRRGLFIRPVRVG